MCAEESAHIGHLLARIKFILDVSTLTPEGNMWCESGACHPRSRGRAWVDEEGGGMCVLVVVCVCRRRW